MNAGWPAEPATRDEVVRFLRFAVESVAAAIVMTLTLAAVLVSVVLIARGTTAVLGYDDPTAPRAPASTTTAVPK